MLKFDENFIYYDISPEISEKIAVWPGDVSYHRKIHLDFKTGGNFLLSSIESTVHLGAHADAPNHYHPQGEGIENRNLQYYLGPCQVITVKKPPYSRILPTDIEGIPILTKRILFRTLSFPNLQNWNTDFISLSPELIHYLYQKGIILIGIDTPSVDLYDDKKLLTHQAVFSLDLAILEGLDLSQINDGIYILVALPLRLKNVDASPVRAILMATSTTLGPAE